MELSEQFSGTGWIHRGGGFENLEEPDSAGDFMGHEDTEEHLDQGSVRSRRYNQSLNLQWRSSPDVQQRQRMVEHLRETSTARIYVDVEHDDEMSVSDIDETGDVKHQVSFLNRQWRS